MKGHFPYCTTTCLIEKNGFKQIKYDRVKKYEKNFYECVPLTIAIKRQSVHKTGPFNFKDINNK